MLPWLQKVKISFVTCLQVADGKYIIEMNKYLIVYMYKICKLFSKTVFVNIVLQFWGEGDEKGMCTIDNLVIFIAEYGDFLLENLSRMEN